MANVKKKCKAHLLPTEKESGLLLDWDNKLFEWTKRTISKNHYHKNVELYFTSDEQIKEGDWYIINNQSISKYDGHFTLGVDCKKIIATNDSSLTIKRDAFVMGIGKLEFESRLPQPSPEFIEAYIEAYNSGNPIIAVMVEYEEGTTTLDYSFPRSAKQNYILKVDKNNHITITKCKESWSKSEILQLLKDNGYEDDAVFELFQDIL